MELEGSLPRLQERATCPHFERDESSSPPAAPFFLAKDLSTSEAVSFRNMLRLYGDESLARRPTPKDGPPLVGCPRLLIKFAGTFHMWRPSPPSET
jgi:hypothetical protein